jgi:hypothetical protein
MHSIPKAARPVIEKLAPALARPMLVRFTFLLFAAMLTTGHQTVTNVPRTLGRAVPGHLPSYHRVFSRCGWCSWRWAHGLATFILNRWLPQGQVPSVGDDTADEHRGQKV